MKHVLVVVVVVSRSLPISDTLARNQLKPKAAWPALSFTPEPDEDGDDDVVEFFWKFLAS